jgi:hypothetical protein
MSTECHVKSSPKPSTRVLSTFHPWLRLPVELKLEVLSYYVPTLQYIPQHLHDSGKDWRLALQGRLPIFKPTRSKLNSERSIGVGMDSLLLARVSSLPRE